MKKITSLFFLGTACALILAFGSSGGANAFENGTNGQIMIAGFGAGVDLGGVGAGVGIGDSGVGGGAYVGGLGAGVNIGGPDQDRYERKRAYHHHRAHKRPAKKQTSKTPQ